jgi:queuine tRNA-ribosyltransferase
MSTSRLNFKLEATATGSRARAGTFRTLHNEVKTPLFMPVGTQATVKAQTFDTLLDSGSQILSPTPASGSRGLQELRRHP